MMRSTLKDSRETSRTSAAMNTDPAPRFEVLGLGCTAVDDLVYIDSFPEPDSKRQVRRRARGFGGLTGTALVAAARAGVRTAFAGCLGPDEPSRLVAEHLASEGIDVSHAPRVADGRVVHSTIVVGEATGSRNIFFQADGRLGAHETLPSEELIRGSAVLFIDHYGMPGNRRACRIARAAGRAVVADFEGTPEPFFTEVLALVDHLILSEDFACSLVGVGDPAAAAVALGRGRTGVTIVTCGAQGCWSAAAGTGATEAARRHPAFRVQAVNTTGCGDVFHGAYAAALARGLGLDARLRYAAAAAALKAREGEVPRDAETARFLAEQSAP